MTVKELYDELGNYIKMGHADTRVIANCYFTIRKGNDTTRAESTGFRHGFFSFPAVFSSCRETAADMPLGLVALQQRAHLQPQRAVEVFEPLAHVLVHRRLGNAEALRGGAHGALMLQQVRGQSARALLDVLIHETTPRARRSGPCAKQALPAAAPLWNIYMFPRAAICARQRYAPCG